MDGDPNFTGALTQTIAGLTSGQEYQLSFYWAGGELFNRTGYTSIQLTGSLGGDPFATPVYLNTNPAGTPGSFSGWTLETFDFTADATSERCHSWRSGRRRPICRRSPFWTACR